MNRRDWLANSLYGAGGIILGKNLFASARGEWNCESTVETRANPVFSIEPVVGDGKWISKKPPKDPVGTFESRRFDVSVGIQATGTGVTENLIATTVAPTEHPEQKIISLRIEKEGMDAEVQPLTHDCARLVAGGRLVAGQSIWAKAIYRLEISKTYYGYSADKLSAELDYPSRLFGSWLGNSPGIQVHSKEVRSVAKEVSRGIEHPFEIAHRFQKWVFENIKGRPMKYTSVTDAIRKKVGDCEERAGAFVALCRAVGIPARLVWVPSHAWAEFCLRDTDGRPRWIPAHTAAYSWFGWTGAHELVLQKGDRIRLPNNGKKVRLVADWLTWKGAKPRVQFTASIKPVEKEGEKTGPGQREKDEIGRWLLTGNHPDNKYLRR